MADLRYRNRITLKFVVSNHQNVMGIDTNPVSFSKPAFVQIHLTNLKVATTHFLVVSIRKSLWISYWKRDRKICGQKLCQDKKQRKKWKIYNNKVDNNIQSSNIKNNFSEVQRKIKYAGNICDEPVARKQAARYRGLGWRQPPCWKFTPLWRESGGHNNFGQGPPKIWITSSLGGRIRVWLCILRIKVPRSCFLQIR